MCWCSCGERNSETKLKLIVSNAQNRNWAYEEHYQHYTKNSALQQADLHGIKGAIAQSWVQAHPKREYGTLQVM
jgi:hypothetical protein